LDYITTLRVIFVTIGILFGVVIFGALTEKTPDGIWGSFESGCC